MQKETNDMKRQKIFGRSTCMERIKVDISDADCEINFTIPRKENTI